MEKTTTERMPMELEVTVSEFRTSEKVTKILGALLKARKAYGKVLKEKQAHHYKYADLPAVKSATSEHLVDNGILEIAAFAPLIHDKHGVRVGVSVRLYHAESAEFLEIGCEAHTADSGPQGIGSVHTYLRRYCDLALHDLAPEDDDGVAAGKVTVPAHVGREHRDPATSRREPPERPTGTVESGPSMADKLELAKDILKRTEGDKEAARQVLKEITTWVKNEGKPDAEEIEGYTDVRRIRSEKMLNMAKHNLKLHPAFGDEVATRSVEPTTSGKPKNDPAELF